MKNKFLLKFWITALVVSDVLVAAGPIDFKQTINVRRVNMSFLNPTDLLRSTDQVAGYLGRHFVARPLARLELTVLNEMDRKRVRNEICASDLIFTTAALADNADFTTLPGSWGFYVHQGNVVSVSGVGLAGERLDSTLRNLSRLQTANKVAAAKYYAVAMTRNLEQIHAANVIWRNAELRNFFATPIGGTYAQDMTEAKLVGGPTAQAEKDAEFATFANTVIPDMYRTLFPDGNEAFNQYTDLLALGAVLVVLNKIPAIAAVLPGGAGAAAAFAAAPMAAALTAAIPNLTGGNNTLAIAAARDEANANGDTKETVVLAAARAIVRGESVRRALLSIPALKVAHDAGVQATMVLGPTLVNLEAVLPGLSAVGYAAIRAVVAGGSAALTLTAQESAAVRNPSLSLPASVEAKNLVGRVAMTQSDVITSLQAALASARDSNDLLTAGLAGDGVGFGTIGDYTTNADNYLLAHPPSIPHSLSPYLRVEAGDQANNAANHVNVDAAIPLLLPNIVGVIPADKAAICAGWTGL